MAREECCLCPRQIWVDKEKVICSPEEGPLLHFLSFPLMPEKLPEIISQSIFECSFINVRGTLVRTKQRTLTILRRGKTVFYFPLYATRLLRGTINLLDNFFGVNQGLRRREKVEVTKTKGRMREKVSAWLWEPVPSQIVEAYPKFAQVEWDGFNMGIYGRRIGSKERLYLGRSGTT